VLFQSVQVQQNEHIVDKEVTMAEKEEQAKAAASHVEEVKEAKSLLDQIIDEGRLARDEGQKVWARDMISEFVSGVMKGEITISKDLESIINARIGQIDRLISNQLNEVMHHPDFQKLEGSWRGLHYLVQRSETGDKLKIRVMNVSKNDLLKDMEKAPEFDQSALFKKIYEEEFGTFGGAAYGALIGDYEFSNHPQDMALLEKITEVAAAAHAPFISAASPQMFGLDSFTDIGAPRDMAKVFQTSDYAKWKSFRESDDSKYVALALPHILARLPYGKKSVPVESFGFEEDVEGSVHTKYLWGNAAYALGTRLTDAFAKYHWCAAIRGVEGGGLVSGLPVHTFRTDEGDVALKCPTEIAITDRREKELADLGFAPLVHCKGTDYAAFFSVQTANKPKVYDTPAATANARLSSQLQYILAVSRFAHYLKSMMRDKIGSFLSRKNAEDFLNRWISNYILLDDDAGQDTKAKFPLREARIEVSEIPGKTGAYRAVAYLRPHYQLDELSVSLRLVAELPPPAKK
jgi:type VI secretion system protein ImpC